MTQEDLKDNFTIKKEGYQDVILPIREDGVNKNYMFTGADGSGKSSLISRLLLNEVLTNDVSLRIIDVAATSTLLRALIGADVFDIKEGISINILPYATKKSVEIISNTLVALTNVRLSKEEIDILNKNILRMVDKHNADLDLTILVRYLQHEFPNITFIQALYPFTDKNNGKYNLLHGDNEISYTSKQVGFIMNFDCLGSTYKDYLSVLNALVAIEIIDKENDYDTILVNEEAWTFVENELVVSLLESITERTGKKRLSLFMSTMDPLDFAKNKKGIDFWQSFEIKIMLPTNKIATEVNSYKELLLAAEVEELTKLPRAFPRKRQNVCISDQGFVFSAYIPLKENDIFKIRNKDLDRACEVLKGDRDAIDDLVELIA